MSRRSNLKGYRVIQDGRGNVTVERIPFYGRDCSQRIRSRKSKKSRPVTQAELALHYRKGK